MAEPIAVEFDLTADELAGYFASGQPQVRGLIVSGLFLILAVLAVVSGAVAGRPGQIIGGVFVGLIGAFLMVGVLRLPQTAKRITARLAGTTKIQLSDRGVEYSGTNLAERIEWSRVKWVFDRPQTWVLMTKAPLTTYYIPKTAVPPAQQEAFVSQLMDWSGSSYKFRKR